MISTLIDLISNNLTDDLLKNKYKSLKNKNKYTGHCYVATETLYYLLDDSKKNDYTPARLKINEETHWFLVEKKTNKIFDITKDQFNFEIDYTQMKKCWFLTNHPSKRTLILINRIHEKINN